MSMSPQDFVVHPSPWAARVTVVEKVYHESQQDPCREVADHSYSVHLRTDEQPWGPRRQVVGGEWIELDLGYLAGKPVSELVVENLEGTFLHVRPSEAELAETAKRTVELVSNNCDMDPFAVVRPGRSARFEPVGRVYARCMCGEAKVKVAATPGDE